MALLPKSTSIIWHANGVCIYIEASFAPNSTGKAHNQETKTILDQCSKDFPEFEAILTSPLPESDFIDALKVLKSSNPELKKLAGSKAPDTIYGSDFALSEKAKLIVMDHAAIGETRACKQSTRE